MAVFSDGRKEFVVKKGSVKKTDFVAFIESLSLCNNSVAIMDNICYTPPYSPEFNAIELCFAKVKRDFRRLNYIPNETKTHVSDMISLAFGNPH
jgi:transposase